MEAGALRLGEQPLHDAKRALDCQRVSVRRAQSCSSYPTFLVAHFAPYEARIAFTLRLIGRAKLRLDAPLHHLLNEAAAQHRTQPVHALQPLERIRGCGREDLDIRNAGRVVRSAHLAPRDRDREPLAAAEIDPPRPRAQREADELARASNFAAVGDRFDRRLRGPFAHARSTIEAQRELGRFRQRFLQLRGDAVGRYDIEADAWAQNDARALRFFIDAMRELEDVDLAGNVEIV